MTTAWKLTLTMSASQPNIGDAVRDGSPGLPYKLDHTWSPAPPHDNVKNLTTGKNYVAHVGDSLEIDVERLNHVPFHTVHLGINNLSSGTGEFQVSDIFYLNGQPSPSGDYAYWTFRLNTATPGTDLYSFGLKVRYTVPVNGHMVSWYDCDPKMIVRGGLGEPPKPGQVS